MRRVWPQSGSADADPIAAARSATGRVRWPPMSQARPGAGRSAADRTIAWARWRGRCRCA